MARRDHAGTPNGIRLRHAGRPGREAADGDPSLVCDQGDVMRVFELSGLTSVFKIVATREDATGQAA